MVVVRRVHKYMFLRIYLTDDFVYKKLSDVVNFYKFASSLFI